MALLAVLGLLLWADRTLPNAGVWALLLLSVSVGFIHGALDAVLLPKCTASRMQTVLFFIAYLLLVVLLGWLLSTAVNLALGVLLVMSVWHFGEPYGRWDSVPGFQNVLTRAVVGGAPVMLPVWLAPAQFTAAVADVVPELGLNGWHALAWVWLALFVGWVLLCGIARATSLRSAWLELFGCGALFAMFSPLMAFALYFGAYHAPVHIRRVWIAHVKTSPAFSARATVAVITLTTIATWLLGAGLGWFVLQADATAYSWAEALRWLIVAFAALTAPHLVLISLSAAFLTEPKNSQ